MNVNCWARRPQTRGSPDPLATGRIPALALRSWTTPEPRACDVAPRVVRCPCRTHVTCTYRDLHQTRANIVITPSPRGFSRYSLPAERRNSAGVSSCRAMAPCHCCAPQCRVHSHPPRFHPSADHNRCHSAVASSPTVDRCAHCMVQSTAATPSCPVAHTRGLPADAASPPSVEPSALPYAAYRQNGAIVVLLRHLLLLAMGGPAPGLRHLCVNRSHATRLGYA